MNFGTAPNRSDSWTWLKSMVEAKNLIVQYEENNDDYVVYAYDGEEALWCRIWKGALPPSVAAHGYSQAQNDADKAEFESLYKPTGNKPLIKKNSDGVTKVQQQAREGSKLELFSQNFCDKRTWFATSTRVTGETMSDSGDGLTWNLSGGPKVLVDVSHGRVSEENKLVPTYGVKVYVDGVEMVEHHPDDVMSFDANGDEVFDYASGTGDFGVNYLTGDVIFKSSQAGKTVTIDYSEVVDSKWYITPASGKRIELLAAELQFSVDTVMKSDFIFQARADVGLHPLMVPYLDDAAKNNLKTVLSATYTWDGTTAVLSSDTSEVMAGEWISLDGSGAYYYIAGIDPDVSVTIVDALGIGFIPSGSTPSAKAPHALFAAGTKLPLGDPTLYKTKFDIIAEANISYPVIPADNQLVGGGWNWRQLIKDVEIFRWDYNEQAYIGIYDKWGMDVEISLGNDLPPEGWKAVVTFYGLSEAE